MTDFLSRIITQKRAEVAAIQEKTSEDQLRKAALKPRTLRPFFGRLKEPGPGGINIIAEIKRASPSKGPIRPDLDPADFAKKYQRGGAAALSVLTDHVHFGGSFEDLRAAREAVNLPVLRKDFIVSSYQIYESAVIGADAVLLIVRALAPDQLASYLGIARELHLDALVEVHSEEELEIAGEAGAKLIGINNRNLNTFDTDIDTAARMAERLTPDQVAVAESGIGSKADVDRLRKAGFFNFLIGESIVRSENPEAFIRALMDSE